MDIWTTLLIVLTAAVYGSCLAAGGTHLFRISLHGLPRQEAAREVRDSLHIAGAGLVLVVLALPVRLIVIASGDPAVLAEPAVWRMLLTGPDGQSAGLRLLGLLLTCAPALVHGRRWRPSAGLAAICGLALIVLSFVVSGDAPRPGRSLVAPFLGLHLAAIAFWIGALWPLLRMAGTLPTREAGAVMRRFGRVATGAVVLLVLAGLSLAAELLGSLAALVGTGYGRVLLLKIVLVAALVALSAANRWRLAPGLDRGVPGAARRLRLSILAEIATVALVLLATAAMVILEAPPVLSQR